MSEVELDHVAFAVAEIAGVVPLVVGELGGRERGAGPGAGFQFWQWEFAGGGALEILEPFGPPDGFVHRFLKARGPGAHHLTFKLPDIRGAMQRAGARGYDVVGFDDSSPSWIEAFLHPKQAQGIVVQLVESHPELQEDGDWQPPPYPASPPAAPEPVRLLGLRLTSHSEDRARRQWQDLLGGQCVPDGRELVFRWPDSPLRLAVSLDAGLPEGPRALEIATDRDLRLPEGPHPALGLPVVCVEE
jgi:catechol 2,3-dioxygenase-like lactoylglutathione lyase family enzyme